MYIADRENKVCQYFQRYEWDEATRSAILSSFFWGYVITQIPAGHLAQKFGPRILLFVLLLVCSVTTILFVPASSLGWEYACAARVILGLAQVSSLHLQNILRSS